MKAWEQIINTAMLGTDKAPARYDFPQGLMPAMEEVEATAPDAETKFLQKAAMVYNYRCCGFVPLQKRDLPGITADAEEKSYCSDKALTTLRAIMDEDNTTLLELWLNECVKQRQLIWPEMLPQVLDKAIQQPVLQSLVVLCSGKRGEWLSRFNDLWNYFKQPTDEEIWQTGKPAERLKLLQNLRKTDPAKARALLQQTWEQENTAAKADLIAVFRVNASPADLPWLEGLQGEKSVKVKEKVTELLQQIPGSSIIKLYEDVLRRAVILKKEKGLLGMLSKTSIVKQLPDDIGEEIYKTGILHLPSVIEQLPDDVKEKYKNGTFNVNTTENDFIIYQIIGFVPPAFWEKQFDTTPAQVVEYFEKYLPDDVGALGTAVSRFKQASWMPYFLGQKNNFYGGFLDLMSPDEQEKYLLQVFKSNANSAVHAALLLNNEWGPEFAVAALGYFAENPYQYHKGVLSQHIKFIPVNAAGRVEKIDSANANMQNSWEKNRAHMVKLLALKQLTIQAFKP